MVHPNGAAMTKGMLRYNEGKAPIALLPTAYLDAAGELDFRFSQLTFAVLEVLRLGAIKYEPENWRKGGSWRSVLNSAFRHINAYQRGEVLDAESEQPHLAHVGANLAFLLEFEATSTGDDDRPHATRTPKPPRTCELITTTGVKRVVVLDGGSDPLIPFITTLLAWRDGGGLEDLQTALKLLIAFYEDTPEHEH